MPTMEPPKGHPSEPILTDHEVVDVNHHRVGRVTDVLFDDRDSRPRWATVRTGLLSGEHLAPIDGSFVAATGVLVLPFDRATVQRAPRPPRDHVLTTDRVREAEQYYALV